MNDEQLSARLTDALERRTQALDGATLSRLRQARARALTQGTRRHHWLTLWLPAAGAMVAAALVTLNVWYVQPQAPGAPDPALLEHLALQASPAPAAEPNFLEWLARQPRGDAA